MPVIEESDDRIPETGTIPFEFADLSITQRFTNTSVDARIQNSELLEELEGLKTKLKAVFQSISKQRDSKV